MIQPHHHELAGYHTHYPALAAALHLAPQGGTVLELGSGLWSTVMLHLACAATQRSMVTLDSDHEWAARFARLESRATDVLSHRIVRVTPSPAGWDAAIDAEIATASLASPGRRPFALAFIDHAPESERRRAIERLRSHVDVFVMHDVDPVWDVAYNVQDLLASFEHRWTFALTAPLTAIFSDTTAIPFDERAALPDGEQRQG